MMSVPTPQVPAQKDFLSRFGLHITPFTREISVKDRFVHALFEQPLAHLQRAVERRLSAALIAPAGTGALACIFAGSAAIGLLKYRSRWRGLFAVLYMSPLFVAGLLIGISSLMFHRNILGLPGNLFSAILANTTQALSFAFLVILAQLTRYDWRMDEAAMVFGARPARCFWEITLPTIWPSILGAFLVSFILAFNNLDITFYNIGAIPTLPTIAWGTLRHGIEPELYSLAAIINGLVFVILIILFFLIRLGLVRLGYRGE